jgi:hypothetical protein
VKEQETNEKERKSFCSPFLEAKTECKGGFLLGGSRVPRGRIRGICQIFRNALLSLVKMRESLALKYVTYTWA